MARRRRQRDHSGSTAKRYVFTRKDCQRGYQAALEKCSQDWDLYVWFFHRIRGFYRDRENAPPF